MVKKVKPILIKKELDREHATKVPFERHPGEIFFTDDERVPYREMEPTEYFEEATDDKDYKEDDKVISIESDSTAAESMLDEDFETTDPMIFDASLMKITTGLRQAAEGFEELWKMIPSVPVTDMPKLVEETPLLYLTPLSKEMVRALQSVGEDELVDTALYEEHQKGVSQVSLMMKYGVTRNRLYKVITGTTQPGGSQYQQGLKREAKGKTVETSKEATPKSEVKLEQELDAPSPKGKGRGKSSKKK